MKKSSSFKILLEKNLIKEFEELAKVENLDRSALVRMILIEGKK